MKEIGIDVVVANEIDEKRSKFYEHLYPHTHMVCGDITNDLVRDGIVKECKEKDVDMVMATPPCQGMSIAGNMNPKDERNQLVYYAVDVILKLKPKFVFLENVPRTLVTEIEVNGETMLIPIT